MLKYNKGLNNIFLKDKLSVYRDQRRNKLKSLVVKIYSNSNFDTDSLENSSRSNISSTLSLNTLKSFNAFMLQDQSHNKKRILPRRPSREYDTILKLIKNNSKLLINLLQMIKLHLNNANKSNNDYLIKDKFILKPIKDELSAKTIIYKSDVPFYLHKPSINNKNEAPISKEISLNQNFMTKKGETVEQESIGYNQKKIFNVKNSNLLSKPSDKFLDELKMKLELRNKKLNV